MRPRFRPGVVGLAALALVANLAGGVARAGAAVIGCGSTITQSTTLTHDIGPCPGSGLTIDGDHVVLDLNGHSVIGTGAVDSNGIFMFSTEGVTVRNGTVTGFEIGIRLQDDSSTTITRMRIAHNVGRYGMELGSSRLATVRHNTVVGNGPFAGISVFGVFAIGNVIDSNWIVGNAVVLADDPPRQETMGIEVHSATSNRISNNFVAGNGYTGIHLGGAVRSTVVTGNTVIGNGFHNQVNATGNGIRLGPANGILDRRFPSENNVVEGNLIRANAANGIVVTAPKSRIASNVVVSNGLLTHAANGPVFDLHDLLPGCDANVWVGNTFGSAFPACAAA